MCLHRLHEGDSKSAITSPWHARAANPINLQLFKRPYPVGHAEIFSNEWNSASIKQGVEKLLTQCMELKRLRGKSQAYKSAVLNVNSSQM